MSTRPMQRPSGTIFFFLAFFLLVANLRPSITSVGPMLEDIRGSFGLSATMAGLLTTLPVFVFGAFAPIARIGQRVGLERTLAGCLVLIAAGTALRSHGSIEALYLGTIVLAAGMAAGNVLLPSFIRRDFPTRVATMTTAYVMVISVVGALASGLAVPLSLRFEGGWRASLFVWAVFATVAFVCWLPYARRAPKAAAPAQAGAATLPLWRSALAWHVVAFMGLQALVYYVLLAWVPLFLSEQGFTKQQAGWLLTLMQIVGLVVGLVIPLLMRRGKDQRVLAFSNGALYAVSILGLCFLPGLAVFWMVVLGLASGTTLILALSFIGMRAGDHRRAASLSMMAQSIGYLIAALGPFAFGWIHDLSEGWTLPMLGLAAAALLHGLFGLGAGRDRQV